MAAEDQENVDYWKKSWGNEFVPWCTEEYHPWLSKGSNLNILTKGRTDLKIFVSLCGDSPDMKWLGDMGHTVVGVDIGKEGFIKFFTRYNIPYKVEDVDQCKGTLYKSDDNKYRFYCCNFFDFNSGVEGKFDGLFDSAAMMAIHPDLRKRYASIMIDLLGKDATCVLERVHLDSDEGPPFKMTKEELLQHFEPSCNVDLLGSYVFEIMEMNMHYDMFTISHRT